MSFETFNFHPHIAEGIKARGYSEPTPIQSKSIPVILEGRDVMGQAQTGTGKTAAFVLPILERLLEGPRGRIRALVLAPTRELAEQIHSETVKLGRGTKLRSCTVYGGVSMARQIKNIRSGAEIVVACPGRLLDLMGQGVVDLSGIEVLVLDEADRMFDMGFMPDVKRILARVPKRRQTLLFSATMPDEILRFARSILRNPATVKIGLAAPVSTVSHALYPVEQHLKTALLKEILKRTETRSVLVFTRTKARATRLSVQLTRAGHPVAALHGDLSQNMRQRALDGFRTGACRILVATDIAARGIDVSRISHVINYDMPESVDAYTHRIGRTGRAESTGEAFTLVTKDDHAAVTAIERVLDSELHCRELEGFDYEAAAPAHKPGGSRPPRRPGFGGGQKRPHRSNASPGPGGRRSGRRGKHKAQPAKAVVNAQ
jgi:ATP-dependent RNA helicase RhlE